jgi:hypothetical protein
MTDFPVIRLEVQASKHSILSALSRHHEEVAAAVEAAVEEFDVSRAIRTEVERVVNAALRETIENGVRSTLTEIAWSDDLRSAIRRAIIEALTDDERIYERGKEGS